MSRKLLVLGEKSGKDYILKDGGTGIVNITSPSSSCGGFLPPWLRRQWR